MKQYKIRPIERYELVEILKDREVLMTEGTKEECEKYMEKRKEIGRKII